MFLFLSSISLRTAIQFFFMAMGSKSDTFSPRRRASPTESMQPICFAETEQTDNSQHNERGCTLAPQVQCYSWDLNTSTVNRLVYKRKFVLINIRLSCECSLHPILRPGLSLKRFEGYLDSLSLIYIYIYVYIHIYCELLTMPLMSSCERL